MVDFSLRKTKGFGKSNHTPQNTDPNVNPYAQQQQSSSRKGSTIRDNQNINPYANLNASNNLQNTNLPSIDKKDKAKMGKSMQRRMSIHQTDTPIRLFQPDNVPALPMISMDQYQLSQRQPNKPLENSLSPSLVPGQAGGPGSVSGPIHTSIHNFSQPLSTFKRAFSPDFNDPESIKVLTDPNFNAENFVSARLSESTASEIEKFSTNLTSLNKKVTGDINALSIETYEKLLDSSQELKSTDIELKFLRNAINELADLNMEMRETAEKTIQLELDQTSELTRSNTKLNNQALRRQSIMVLEKLWSTEMNSLFKHVEGAQKYVSAIPGRHIIAESGRWSELNAATFKALQPAHIFILNDLILIATKRRKVQKKSTDSQDLIADQCWPLREIQLNEIQSQRSDKPLYTINITYNSLSYTYQTDRKDQYIKVIQAYRRARDELRDITEAEDIRKKKLRDSMQYLAISEGGMKSPVKSSHSRKSSSSGINSSSGSQRKQSFNAGHRRSGSHSNLLQDISTRMHSRSKSLDQSSNFDLLKKLDDEIDQLDVLIFRKTYAKPIEAFEEMDADLTKMASSCTEEESLLLNVVRMKISARKNEILKDLIAKLKFSESNPVSAKQIESYVQDLIQLGQRDIAKTLFLTNRTSNTKYLISKIIEGKDYQGKPKISEYIVELSIVKFQNIKLAIELYKKLFREKDQLSYLIDWVLSETKKFIGELTKLLSNVKLQKSKLEYSILVINRQIIELKDFGINVEYIMGEFFKSIDVEES